MISQKSLLKLLAAGTFALTLAACGDNNAEDAGEELDEIVTDAGNAVAFFYTSFYTSSPPSSRAKSSNSDSVLSNSSTAYR